MIRIGPYEFTSLTNHAFNDEIDAYVEGRSGGVGRASKELHTWYYADQDSDQVIGITLNGPRMMLERLGEVRVTLPSGKRVVAEGVEEYLEGKLEYRSPYEGSG